MVFYPGKAYLDIFGHNNYARLRFGLGDEFSKGKQVNYVLGDWNAEEKKDLPELYDYCIQVIKSFCTIGIARTMNQFNKRKKD